ncbi:hypothetical protein ACQJBY_010903 [Aegilops geniculata]
MNLEEARLLLLSQPSATAVVEAIFTLQSEVQPQVGILLWDWWTTMSRVHCRLRPWLVLRRLRVRLAVVSTGSFSESDSLSLVQALISGDSDKRELGVLFREAWKQLHRSL